MLYVVFGDHSEHISKILSSEFEIAGYDRTLDAAVAVAQTMTKKPEEFLILGSALVTGIIEGSLNYGKALLENLKELRDSCPDSRIVLILSHKASDQIINEVAKLGIYDIHKVESLKVEELLGIIRTRKNFSNYSIKVEAPKDGPIDYIELKPNKTTESNPEEEKQKISAKERFRQAKKKAGEIVAALKVGKSREKSREKPREESASASPVDQENSQDAYRDVLTGCFTRRFLLEKYSHDGKFVVVFIDLDKFKPVNDILGHEAGDRVLAAFGRMLCANLKGRDVAVRWGGDEFVLVLPETSEKEARKVVENLKNEWGKYAPDTGNLTVGFSAGVAPGEGYAGLQEAVRKADKLMYEAKQNRKPQAESPRREEPVAVSVNDPFQTAAQVFRGLFSVLGAMVIFSAGVWALNFILSLLGKSSPALNATVKFVLEFWQAVYVGLLG